MYDELTVRIKNNNIILEQTHSSISNKKWNVVLQQYCMDVSEAYELIEYLYKAIELLEDKEE